MHNIELTDDEVIDLIAFIMMMAITGHVPPGAKESILSITEKLEPHRVAIAKESADVKG